jgi:hypothetical protein
LPKIQYKAKSGVLHIGGGRFFYTQEPVEVSEHEKGKLLETYPDLVGVEPEQMIPPTSDGKENPGKTYTKSEIKKLNADEQRNLITELGGNPEDTNNEEERIALILALQEEQTEE